MITRGEKAFSALLDERGISWAYEEASPGCSTPDFRVTWRQIDCFFEVKDRENVDDSVLFLDVHEAGEITTMPEVPTPCSWIRGKINKASKKFRRLKGSPCALVMFPATGFVSDLEEADFVIGAMYGDTAMAIDHSGRARMRCIDNGKLFIPGTRRPINTTVSALVTLRIVDVGAARLRAAWVEQRHLPYSQRRRSSEEVFNDRHLGAIVWENIFATTPFPKDLFVGPYDERWSGDRERIGCVHRGEAVATCYGPLG